MTISQKAKLLYQKKALGEVVDFIDGDRGENYPSQGEFYPAGDCLFLSTKNVPNTRFSFEEKFFISAQKDAILRKGKLQRGDYVLTTRGTVGNFAYYDESVPYKNVRINSGMVILRKKSAELYENYFRYFLASNSFSEQVKSRVSGSAQPQLPIRDMLSMEIKLPAFPTQIRITSVLSAYDDLIENNEKRIKILEEMAQLLYTEWFVKFRFPRQKEGGQAGHEKVKMVDSKTEYGLIPEGWEVKKLSQTVLINPAERVESGNAILHVPMEALSNTSCIIDITKTKLRDSASGVKFRNGDTLFARITPCLENGKTGFVQFLRENEIACGSTEFVVLRSRLLTPEYVYFLSRDKDFRETAKFTMTGASGRQRVRAEFFEEYLVVQPLKGVLDKYSQLVSANFREIGKLVKQNIVLQKIRDLLIPQLVAGKRELKNYGKC